MRRIYSRSTAASLAAPAPSARVRFDTGCCETLSSAATASAAAAVVPTASAAGVGRTAPESGTLWATLAEAVSALKAAAARESGGDHLKSS